MCDFTVGQTVWVVQGASNNAGGWNELWVIQEVVWMVGSRGLTVGFQSDDGEEIYWVPREWVHNNRETALQVCENWRTAELRQYRYRIARLESLVF